MSTAEPLVRLLADLIRYTSHGNRWHCLAAATDDLSDADLAYRPVPEIACDWDEDRDYPSIMTPRRALQHVATQAARHGDRVADRTDDESEQAWDAVDLATPAGNAAALVAAVDAACRCLHARALRVRDAELTDLVPVGDRRVAKGFFLMDGGVLHPAWHFGQVAFLSGWRRAAQQADLTRPTAPPGPLHYPGERDWTDFHPAPRTELCLRLLTSAYREQPWQSLRPMVEGATPAEMTWAPCDGVPPIWHRVEHVAHCKVVYADHAFGEAKLSWGDCSHVLGTRNGETDPEQALLGLDRAHEFLADHVAGAAAEDLDREHPMHHGVPHTGWQVVASMSQHDAWHGAQVAILRAAYRALAAS